MATDTPKTSQTRKRDFIVRRIGKFWILKTHNKTKRLVFLDNAQDVQIEENILIADEQLFEIQEDEKGDISFRKVEDLSYVGMDTDDGQQRNDYNCSREEAVTNVTTEGSASVKHDNDTLNLNVMKQTDPDYNITIKPEILRESEESACAVNQKQHIYTGSDEVICGVEDGSDIYRGSDDSVCGAKQDQHIYSGPDEVIYSVKEGSDLYRGSEDYGCGATKGQETTDLTARDYVNIDRYIPKATQETSLNRSKSFNAEFDVEVESSDLAKKCCIEGKMTLRLNKNEIAFEDPRTTSVKYSFPLNWIRRFNRSSQLFSLEVGRRCPHGEGTVTCGTSKAEKIFQQIKSILQR